MDEVTELRVIFEDDNRAYTHGLWLLMEEIFIYDGVKLKHVDDEASMILSVDIYVIHLIAGMEMICRPEFKLRKKRCMFIYINEGLNEPDIHMLPLCIQNNIFLRRNDSLEVVRFKLRYAWRFLWLKYFDDEDLCRHCQPVSLTKAELLVAENICRGHTLNQIALTSLITPKTISTHKRNIMSKLNLHSDVELLNFMTHWMSMERNNDIEI